MSIRLSLKPFTKEVGKVSLIVSLNESQFIHTPPYESCERERLISDLIGHLIAEQAELLTKIETGEVSKEAIEVVLMKLIDQKGPYTDRHALIQEMMDHMFGYGILQSYLENPEVTDLIGTRFDTFFIKENGQTKNIPLKFANEAVFENFCKLIVIRNGGMLNENDCHARVADEHLKLRINAVIPPRSPNGPFLSIRKHRLKAHTLRELTGMGMLDEKAYQIIEGIATGESRFLLCGKGAAGKTTLLRAMLNALGTSQRTMVCEADMEIYPDSPTVVVQRVMERGPYGKPATLNQLIKDGLTMSLDGYCIGEITGPEAWEFVKAGYTDHRVMGTIHSSGTEEALKRLLTLSETSDMKINQGVAEEMIRQSVDYVIYLKAFKVEAIDQLRGRGNGRKMENIYQREVRV